MVEIGLIAHCVHTIHGMMQTKVFNQVAQERTRVDHMSSQVLHKLAPEATGRALERPERVLNLQALEPYLAAVRPYPPFHKQRLPQVGLC